MFTTARLIYVAGKEGYLPALFGRHNSMLKTPLNAMCLQAGITIAFILIGGGFRSLINFAVVASWAFYFLTVSGLPQSTEGLSTHRSGVGTRACNLACQGAHVGKTLQDVDYYASGLLRRMFRY